MNEQSKSNFSLKNVVIQFLFIALFVFILIWLFPMKSDLKNALNSINKNEDISILYDRIFSENIITMKDAAKSYYTTPRLPQTLGDKVRMNLGDMLEKNLIIPFVDSKGKQCDLIDSYVEITKEQDEYVMKVNLKCTDQENYILVYMGCYDYCKTTICEKNQSDVKKPIINNIKNIINNNNSIINNNNNNNVIVIPPAPTPDPDPKPDPEPEPGNPDEYEYKYGKKTVTWGSWSNWSDTEVTSSQYRKVNQRTVKRTFLIGYNVKTINDLDKPIYGTKDVQYGTKVETLCDEYALISTGGTTATGDWVFQKYIVTDTASTVNQSNNTVKYIPVPDADKEWVCGSQCSSGTKFTYKVYKRSSVVTGGSSEYKCIKQSSKTTILTAKKTVLLGYEKKTTKEPVYEDRYIKQYQYQDAKVNWDYKWSHYNDRSLLNAGYEYTGDKRKI